MRFWVGNIGMSKGRRERVKKNSHEQGSSLESKAAPFVSLQYSSFAGAVVNFLVAGVGAVVQSSVILTFELV